MDTKLPVSSSRNEFGFFLPIPTRWSDSDNFGHVNNSVYYTWFDTVICYYLTRIAGYDVAGARIINVTAETTCQFKKSVIFPQVVDAGLGILSMGRSSVRYHVGVFVQGDDAPCAVAQIADVFVDRKTMRPSAIPDEVRVFLEQLRSLASALPPTSRDALAV